MKVIGGSCFGLKVPRFGVDWGIVDGFIGKWLVFGHLSLAVKVG